MPETAELGQLGALYVHWQASSQYNKWHLMWKQKVLPDKPQYWSAVELEASMGNSFSREPPTLSPGLFIASKYKDASA